MTFPAVFAPIPGAFEIVLASPAKIANLNSSAVIVDKIPIAPFGPIPLTVINNLKTVKSSLFANPNSATPSSFICKNV